jgi:phage gp29-like protein
MIDGQPLVTNLESIRIWRQSKYNPLRTLTPAKLATALEAFEIGYLREAAMIFETVADRDDTLKSVKPKREKEVSQLDRQVVALPNTGEAGEQHRQILEDFWENVRTVNAYDRNERGGFRRLVKQMMTAVSFRYAAHHIVWRPIGDTLRATFEFVPLWLFENVTGTLRYLKSPWASEGELLAPGEWMVTQGDGLMIACSIGYQAKRSAFNDWLVFSEKFSVPGTLGRTKHGKDTPEGRAMRDAVQSFGHDWVGVIYGDDGTHEKPIEIIQAQGNPSGMPMPAVVERVDRKFAALYRGADLSTMSAGGGEGTGASLQGKEKDILLADDAEAINETLAEVSRLVIEWHFGFGVEPLAKVELIVPSDDDEKFYLESIKELKAMGVRVSKDAVLERLAVQEAGEGEEALGEIAAKPVEANDAWMQFARETGTLGIPRAIMPQIKSGNRAAMVNLLRARGIDYVKTTIKPADLKPTQAEYSTEKVEKARTYHGAQRALLVSSDHHVVDGHHQYLAALQDAPNKPIEVFKIKAPIMHVIGLVLQMRSTVQEDVANANDGTFRDWVDQVRGTEPETAVQRLRKALSADMKPIGDALASALSAGDEAAFRAALKKVSENLPDLMASDRLEAELATLMAEAFTSESPA